MSAQVLEVTPTRIKIRAECSSYPDPANPISVLELDRAAADAGAPPDIKAGDRVTLFYTLNIERVAREESSSGSVPSPKDSGVIDDRAFLNAKNDR